MRRDRLIALHEFITATVPDAEVLGALRSPSANPSWIIDAKRVLGEGYRAILSGDISNFDEIASDVRELLASESLAGRPDSQIAILIHWSQALAVEPNPLDLHCFESVNIAIDASIPDSLIRLIEERWPAKWVLVSKVGLSWNTLIPALFKFKPNGYLTVLAPGKKNPAARGSYLSPDELAIHMVQLSYEHPLVRVQPAPPEWYLPSELSTWNQTWRDATHSRVILDTRENVAAAASHIFSFVVPFRWTGEDIELQRLRACLESVETVRRGRTQWDLIISVDRSANTEPLSIDTLKRNLKFDLGTLAIVDTVRDLNSAAAADWRAGFIRNQGAQACHRADGYFAFIDADVRVIDAAVIQNKLDALRADILLMSDPKISRKQDLSFRTATSSFVVIQKSLFKKIGGFADAFTSYGCEDNFLIWSASQRSAQMTSVAASHFEHLRDNQPNDSGAAKMKRLRTSADLMYRLTLDPDVHSHFFSALGDNVWLRAALKHSLRFQVTRLILGPFVFFFTLIESSNRPEYLRGIFEDFVWIVRRLGAQVRRIWAFIERYTWVALRSNLWRIPYALTMSKAFLMRHTWVALRSNLWRIPYARTMSKVFLNRGLGQCARALGTIKKYFVIWILVPGTYVLSRPKHWLRLHGWRVTVGLARLRNKVFASRDSNDI